MRCEPSAATPAAPPCEVSCALGYRVRRSLKSWAHEACPETLASSRSRSASLLHTLTSTMRRTYARSSRKSCISLLPAIRTLCLTSHDPLAGNQGREKGRALVLLHSLSGGTDASWLAAICFARAVCFFRRCSLPDRSLCIQGWNRKFDEWVEAPVIHVVSVTA